MAGRAGSLDVTLGTNPGGETSQGTKLESEMEQLKELVRQQQDMLQKLLESSNKPVTRDASLHTPSDEAGEHGLPMNGVQQLTVASRNTNHMAIEADPKDVNKVIKFLTIPAGGCFAPDTEKELDDVFDLWTRQTLSSGHEVQLLKLVVMRTGSETVQIAAQESGAILQPWEQFVDRLARKLFQFSRQLEAVENQIMATDRQENV